MTRKTQTLCKQHFKMHLHCFTFCDFETILSVIYSIENCLKIVFKHRLVLVNPVLCIISSARCIVTPLMSSNPCFSSRGPVTSSCLWEVSWGVQFGFQDYCVVCLWLMSEAQHQITAARVFKRGLNGRRLLKWITGAFDRVSEVKRMKGIERIKSVNNKFLFSLR